MGKFYIDISSEEKKQEVYNLFLTFKKKGDIFKYYHVSDNTDNTNYLRDIGKAIGFDFSIYKQKPKRFCLKCGKELKSSSQKKFCSNSCAASYNNVLRGGMTEETKEKIGNALRNKVLDLQKSRGYTYIKKIHLYEKECPFCHTKFYTTSGNRPIYCSKECSHKAKREKDLCNTEEYHVYRLMCAFKFALNQFSDCFDFDLIRKNGWYKPKNHGDNLKGVSRDHMFSVNEGYKQGIDPYYISHPANCKLMLQEDNFKKKANCSISKEELYKRVNEWNLKYGEYKNKILYEHIERFKEKLRND